MKNVTTALESATKKIDQARQIAGSIELSAVSDAINTLADSLDEIHNAVTELETEFDDLKAHLEND